MRRTRPRSCRENAGPGQERGEPNDRPNRRRCRKHRRIEVRSHGNLQHSDRRRTEARSSSIGSRLDAIELDLTDHDASHVEVLKQGVETCSLDVEQGVLHLSNATVLMHKNTAAILSGANTALVYDTQ